MRIKYLIVGRTAAGKSAIARELCNLFDLVQVRSYTTRPPRNQAERDGVSDHIFISDDEFDQIKPEEIAAFTIIGDVRYCTTFDVLDQSDVYVIDPNGVYDLRTRSMYRDYIFRVIYVDAPEDVRKARFMKRGGSEEDFVRRSRAEDTQFSEMEKNRNYDYRVCNDHLLYGPVSALAQYVQWDLSQYKKGGR